MRAIVSCGVVLVLAASTGTAADIDAAKLVGTWTRVGAKTRALTEFTADGKVITTMSAKGKEIKSEGTYKVEGDKLTIKTADAETVNTITKLTDSELEFVSEKPKMKYVLRKGKTKRKDK